MRYTLPQPATRHADGGMRTRWPVPPRYAGASPSPPSSAVRCPWPARPSRWTRSRSPATPHPTTSPRSAWPPTYGRRHGLTTTTPTTPRRTPRTTPTSRRCSTPARWPRPSARRTRRAGGSRRSSSPTTTPTTTPRIRASARLPAAAAPAAAAARSGRTASKFPAELIDTKDWYLTLPTGKEGSPDTVDGSELANYHSKFFELTQARDGIVFTANAGGATTSGSHYPRSELREMNGEEKASWDGRKGTHIMELDQAITETPSAKPDVIAGQIHGTSDDLMQIHLSGNQLTVKYADGKKKVSLDDDYQLGTRFKVKIESSGGHVKVWYNGQQKADLAINSSTSYFKAGAYVNSQHQQGREVVGGGPGRDLQRGREALVAAENLSRRRRSAAVTVLCSSSAVVTGPTPPGHRRHRAGPAHDGLGVDVAHERCRSRPASSRRRSPPRPARRAPRRASAAGRPPRPGRPPRLVRAGQVHRARVADRHGRVAREQQHRDRLADHQAAPDDDRAPAGQLDAVVVEQPHAPPPRSRARRPATRPSGDRGSPGSRRRRPSPARSSAAISTKSTPGGSGVCRMIPCTVGVGRQPRQRGADVGGGRVVGEPLDPHVEADLLPGPDDRAGVPGGRLVRRREHERQASGRCPPRAAAAPPRPPRRGSRPPTSCPRAAVSSRAGSLLEPLDDPGRHVVRLLHGPLQLGRPRRAGRARRRRR